MATTTPKKPRTPRERYAMVTVPCGPELHKHLVAEAERYAKQKREKKPNIAKTARRLLGKAMNLGESVWGDTSE
jgi:hypothetical protein